MAINLTDDELEELVEKVTERVLNNMYSSVGRNVIQKFTWIVGVLVISILTYFAGSGHINIK